VFKDIRKDYIIYIGRSDKAGEFCKMTIGHSANIETRQVLKGFKAIYKFRGRMTLADAKSIEGHAQTIADRYFGHRSDPENWVKDGYYDRDGARPNRTKDWWHASPSKKFIGLMMIAIAEGYIRRFKAIKDWVEPTQLDLDL